MAETTISESSTNKLHVHKVEYEWKITDFGLRVESGISIASSTFPSNGKNKHMWFMVCTFQKENFIRYTLPTINVVISLKMKNPCLTPNTVFTSFTLYSKEVESAKTGPRRCVPSANNMISFDSSQLKKDEITIVAKLQFCCNPNNTIDVVEVPKNNLGLKLYKLLSSASFSDVVLLADGMEFPAHKNILAARSPVFEAMFNHNMMETQTSKVEIEDISAEVVKGMLHFIYSDEAPPKLDGMSQEMILVAEKYDLPRLKAMCERNLASKLSVENASEILVFADKLSAVQLKKAASKMVIKYGDTMASTPEFKEIMTSRPTLAYELLSKILKWN